MLVYEYIFCFYPHILQNISVIYNIFYIPAKKREKKNW